MIKTKKVLFGTHIFCGLPMLTEAVSQLGYDMVWIDMEHTPIDKWQIINNLIAVRAGGSKAYVRIPWNEPVLAKPILDMGPDGIIFPYIRSAEDAKRAVRACEYPPYGERGFGPMRASNYGAIAPNDFVRHKYRDTKRIIQIEHIDAVNGIDNILNVTGIDGFIIGPNDLSGSCGHIGNPNHPDMQPIYDHLCRKLFDAGVLFGVSMGYRPNELQRWLERGVGMLFTGTDISAVTTTARNILNELKDMVDGIY